MNAAAPRIFMGLTECSGYISRLKQGLDALGVASVFINARPHRFRYERTGPRHGMLKLVRWVGHERIKASHVDPYTHLLWCVFLQLVQALLMAWAIPRFEVFVFSFRASFLGRMLDLPILRALGKRILYFCAGSDTRPPYLDGSIFRAPIPFDAAACVAMTRAQKKAIRWIERYTDVIISFPLYSQNHEKPFVCNTRLGFPMPRPEGTVEPMARPSDGAIRIVHTPSDPVVKGSSYIRDAVSALNRQGLRIDLVELSGRPNLEVLQALSGCDFAVDQVFSDAPITGVGTEAALFGRPTILAGYAWPDIRAMKLDTERQPPSRYCHPDELEATIRELATDAGLRESIGGRARDYVAREWLPIRVAERFLRIVRDDFPKDWYFDPADLRYVHGWGLPEDRVRERIRAMVHAGGVPALQVGDKRDLEAKMVAFAGR